MRKLFLIPMIVACGYKPSQELLTARNAYNTAAQSQAATLTPAELHEAKVALDRAERFDRDDQGSAEAKDQAYIAVRKAEWVQAKASIAASEQQLASADKRFVDVQGNLLSRTRGELAGAQKLTEQERQRATEAQALAAQAESREREAMEKLAQAEKMSQDARGQVITLSSGLLFKTNQSVLMPAAHSRLDQVAEALKKVPNREFLIEGHTDAIGGEEKNIALSERRAQAVKSYLVSRGVDENRVRISGAGKSRPIADNGSAEGRAMNRRVEIVVLKNDTSTATAK